MASPPDASAGRGGGSVWLAAGVKVTGQHDPEGSTRDMEAWSCARPALGSSRGAPSHASGRRAPGRLSRVPCAACGGSGGDVPCGQMSPPEPACRLRQSARKWFLKKENDAHCYTSVPFTGILCGTTVMCLLSSSHLNCFFGQGNVPAWPVAGVAGKGPGGRCPAARLGAPQAAVIGAVPSARFSGKHS